MDSACCGWPAISVFASKWPGGLSTVSHMYWRDQPFIPPVAPFSADEARRLYDLQMYDLTRDYSQVIPVDTLGLTHQLGPLIRLFDSHDLAEIEVYDQLVAASVDGHGWLIATSLDHSHPAGQWLLGKLARWAADWHAAPQPDMNAAPGKSIPSVRLSEFAVARVNGVLGLDEGWKFAEDPQATGEAAGWMLPGFDDRAWETLNVGAWEWQGHDYDGMAWYRRTIDAPADWAGAKLRLIADGVDDAYTVWVNGKAVATHGSFMEHAATVFQQQTVTDITDHIVPGQPNTIALQVVDITGAGGIWCPIYITAE